MDYPPTHYSIPNDNADVDVDVDIDRYDNRPPLIHHNLSDATLDQWPKKLNQSHSYSSTSFDQQSHTASSHRTAVTPVPLPPEHFPKSNSSIWSSIIPDSLPCRFYIFVVILQTIIDLIIEGILVLKFNQAAQSSQFSKVSSARRLPVYFSIFGFAHVFQFILAVDAVWMRNTLQFFFLAAFNLIFLAYAILQIFEIHDALLPSTISSNTALFDISINALVIIIPIVIAVAEFAYLFLGWSIWREFGWKVYKLLGADRQVRKMYMHYQILACIMKFDVFFWAGFSVQLIWLVLQPTNVEFYITVAALPVSLLVLIAGHFSARYEHRQLMYAFMVSCVGACGYFCFKLFRIVQQRDNDNVEHVLKSLIAFAVIAIMFLIATFIWSCIVLSNFDAGLKYHMSKNKSRSTQTQQLRRRATQRQDLSHAENMQPKYEWDGNSKRMSID